MAEEPDGYDSALEQALCREPFFREQGLKLFRSVTLEQLRPAPGAPGAKDGWEEERAPYLLCRGRRPLVMFRVSRERRRGPVPQGLLDLSFLREAGTAVPLTVLRRSAERLLGSDETALWDWPMEPVPDQCRPQLVREGLVEQRRQGDRLGWTVSARGQDQGLSWCRWFEEDRLREGPAWSREVRRRLEPMWTDDPQGRRPLAGRLRDLANGRSGVEVVKRLADTDLGTYLRRNPEDMDELRETLHLGPGDTCSQAAALILKRLRSRDKLVREEGVSLMRLLAGPLTE